MVTMLASNLAVQDRRDNYTSPELSAIVESIGVGDFEERVIDLLNSVVGADHCEVYRQRGTQLRQILAVTLEGGDVLALSEMSAYEIKRQLSMVSQASIRIDVMNTQVLGPVYSLGAPLRQTLLLSVRKPDSAYCFRVVRSAQRPPVTDEDLDVLRGLASVLVSMVARHNDLVSNKPNLTPALGSLTEIEQCIAPTNLSRREGEVCSRILYGLSSFGIALDLGIGKESVMTYRKRAYQRLGIGSQRELLMWYLALWEWQKLR
jgi:DNA-binding CsgD family transcriptional regulator